MSQLHTLHRGGKRFYLNDYGSNTVTPYSYPLIAWWKSSAITYANPTVLSGSLVPWRTIDGGGYLASGSTSTGPTYQITSSVIPSLNNSLVVFNSQNLAVIPSLNLTNSLFTMAVVCYSSAEGVIFGNSTTNLQVRKFRSGVNNISIYDGVTEAISSTFSTVAGNPVVCWYQHVSSGGVVNFYENQTARGTSVAWRGFSSTGLDRMCGNLAAPTSFVGGISEIIIWRYVLSLDEVKNMYLNYFKLNYPGAFSG
jgi:hypothetical protein